MKMYKNALILASVGAALSLGLGASVALNKEAAETKATTMVTVLDGTALNLTSTGVTDPVISTYDGVTFETKAPTAAKTQSSTTAVNAFSKTNSALIGKKDAYVRNTTAFAMPITKFELYSNKGASASVVVGVTFGTSAIESVVSGAESTWESTLSTTDAVYDASVAIPEGATFFRVQVMSAHNAQLQFRITTSDETQEEFKSLFVDTTEVKDTYSIGESYDASSMKVYAKSDLHPDGVDVTKDAKITFNPTKFLTPGRQNVEFNVAYKTLSFDGVSTVNVEESQVYTKVTNIKQLVIGSSVVFGIDINDRSFLASEYVSGNNVRTIETGKSDANNVYLAPGAGVYTVGVASFGENSGLTFASDSKYLYAAGGLEANMLKAKEEIDGNSLWDVSIDGGSMYAYAMGDTVKNSMAFNKNSGDPILSCYAAGAQTPVVAYVLNGNPSADDVAHTFAARYMHLEDYTESKGYCSDEEHAYYAKAKEAWNNLDAAEKAAFKEGEADAYARLAAWANANGDEFDAETGNLAHVYVVPSVNEHQDKAAFVALIGVVGFVVLGSAIAFATFKKRA